MLISEDLKARIDIVSRHLSLGAVVVVGAGLSISNRFPDTAGLTSLLWDALDFDMATRKEFAQALGQADASAKELVGDNKINILAAWAAIASSIPARARFQKQFAALDAQRSAQPSRAHEALACLIHAGVVECVVSLNWDTALESAYKRLYGTSLPENLLFKPHGDAAKPDDPWILPHEPGLIPPEVTTKVTLLASEHARTLLVIGFSGSDRVVVDELIKPLDRSWRTVRVGPNATGLDDLTAGAETVIPLLAEPYENREDHSSWCAMSFSGRRDIEAALRGERLGPQDIFSCPELDEVEVLARSLRMDKAVVLNGQTGSGKSITAYQALYRLTREGFEILRLRDNARTCSLRTLLNDLAQFPHKKVLLVDDAQDMSPDTVRELAEAAAADLLILIVGIDHVAGGVRTVHLSARLAVVRLSRFVREERATLFPRIRDLDNSVGTFPNDVFFDRRIDVAERQLTSWQFFYILTGGWRRVRRDAIELRDNNRADVALLAIAVAQIAGVDAGVKRDELLAMLNVLGRDNVWLDSSLDTLRARKLVTEADGRLRCTHLEAAFHMVAWMLHPPESHCTLSSPRVEIPPIPSATGSVKSEQTAVPSPKKPRQAPLLSKEEMDEDRGTACALIELALDSPNTPLRGCTWLSGQRFIEDTHWILVSKGVLAPDRYDRLAHRALLTPTDGDLAAAAQLLSEIVKYSCSSVMDTVKAHASRLSDWYGVISPENGWALGDLANTIHNVDKSFAAELAGYTDPQRLANLVLDGGWPHIYSTSHALDRICTADGIPVRGAVAAELDEDAYKHMLSTGNPNPSDAALLIENIASADPDLSLRLFEYAAPMLAHQFVDNPVRQWSEISECVMFVLGYAPDFLRVRKRPLANCRRVAQSFIRALDRNRVAETIAGPSDQWAQMNFHEFIRFLSEADPTTFADIVDRVDMTAFEKSLRSHPEKPCKTALYVCACLWENRPDSIHDLLDRLEPDLAHLDSLFVYMAPDVACRALLRGLPLDLELDHDRWGWAASVLARLHQHNPQVAREVAHANREGIKAGLIISKKSDPLEGLNKWVSECDRIAPGLIDSVISDLPKGAVTAWGGVITRSVKHRRTRRKEIAPLVHRAARASGHVQMEAKALLVRFPALAHEGPTGTTAPSP